MQQEHWQQEVGVVEEQMQYACLWEDSCILPGKVLHGVLWREAQEPMQYGYLQEASGIPSGKILYGLLQEDAAKEWQQEVEAQMQWPWLQESSCIPPGKILQELPRDPRSAWKQNQEEGFGCPAAGLSGVRAMGGVEP